MYPALAVVEEWKRIADADPDLPRLADVLYIGAEGGLETGIVPRAGVRMLTVKAGALRGVGPVRLATNIVSLLRGCLQAVAILRQYRPDVLLATGGYASTPAAVAARLIGCPVLVYLPDIRPGLAVRFLSHLAQRVAVSFEAAVGHFPPRKVVLTGYPVRPALFGRDRESARQQMGLDPARKTILVLGGSRGARSINRAVDEALEELLRVAQVVHMTGDSDYAAAIKRREMLPPAVRGSYHVFSYLYEEMVPAMLSADMAIARAGAATMGEFAAAGLPSILVPYPYSGQHQEANAEFMASQGAARHMPESSLSGEALARVVEAMLKDETSLGAMSDRAARLARRNAARDIARELAQLAGGQS